MQELWKAAEAAAWTAVAFDGLLPLLSDEQQEAICALCARPKTIFVAAFSYYAGSTAGNMALYARGEDYHRVIGRRLARVCDALHAQYPAHCFAAAVDHSPVPEQAAAILGGLAARGRHNLLLLPTVGSYHFLGTVISDMPWEGARAPAPQLCTDCGACLKACPTGAIGAQGFDAARCLSHISQKKGVLADGEERALKAAPLCWGCDICQRACPCNKNAQQTSIAEFREDLLCTITRADVENLTQKQFRAAYGARAFAWRGVSVLRRNLSLQARD